MFARFFFLMLCFGGYTTTYNSLPILFYRPSLQCLTSEGAWEPCNETQMCAERLPFRFDSAYYWIQSLSMEKQLYCERKI